MPTHRPQHISQIQFQQRELEERANRPFRGAVFGKITSSLPASESVALESFLGNQNVGFAYPFASTNAWIRGIPETNTTMLTIIGGDSKDLTPLGYFDVTKADHVTKYIAETDRIRGDPSSLPGNLLPYRDLNVGEIDIGSKYSQLYFGLNDTFQARGGLSHINMSSLTMDMDVVTLRINGPHHSVSKTLNDEIRFGAVRRTDSTSTATNPTAIKSGLFYAKEQSTILNWLGIPNKLLDTRSGIVVEDDGKLGRQSKTQQNLRHRSQYYSTNDSTRLEIDENGNWAFSTSSDGIEGGSLDIPAGKLEINVNQTTTIKSLLDMELSTNTQFKASAVTSFHITTPGNGEVNADFGLDLKTQGVMTLQVITPGSIQLGAPVSAKFPLLVGSTAYISSLTTLLGAEATLYGNISSYGTAAAQAWAAVGAVMAALDPSLVTTTSCMAAGAAGAALALAAVAAQVANATHLPTISPAPAGFMSVYGVAS